MHNLCIFDFFVRKSFLTKTYFLTAEINLTNPGSIVYLSCCLSIIQMFQKLSHVSKRGDEPCF